MPLYLRGAAGSMGNHFGLVFVKLPIAEPTREGRLEKLKERMGLVKASPTGPLAFEILRAFWAPISGRLALSVSLLSYAGELRVGVCADANLANGSGGAGSRL